MVIRVQGAYKNDGYGFREIYSENRIYTVALATGEWSYISVGQRAANGMILTQEIYNQLKAGCDKTGEFELPCLIC